MNRFKTLALVTLAWILAGCSLFVIDDRVDPRGKVVMFVALEDEEDTFVRTSFATQKGMDYSLRLRQVSTRINTGAYTFGQVNIDNLSRVLDTVPHIHKGDLVVAAVPAGNDWDVEAGKIPVIFEIACKAADLACMEQHSAPEPHVGAIVRALEAGEFETYAQVENFSVYFTQDREQVRPLPQ